MGSLFYLFYNTTIVNLMIVLETFGWYYVMVLFTNKALICEGLCFSISNVLVTFFFINSDFNNCYFIKA